MASKKGRKKSKKSKKSRARVLRRKQEQIITFKEICPIKPNYTIPHTKTAIKTYFYEKYGFRCWLCGQTFSRNELTLHHVIPYHLSQHTVVEESSIVCQHCHFDIINEIPYNSKEYWTLMEKMYDNIKQWDEEIL